MPARSSVTSGRWPRLAFIALFAAVPLLYFIYLPVSYSFDGTVFSHMLRYALLKDDPAGVLQIHHLLYFPVNYLLYRLLAFLFHYRVLEFFHLQLFSMLCGAGTLVLVERMLKKLNLGTAARLAGVSLVAFSLAFWQFSVDAEIHVPGLLFVTAGMYLLLFLATRPWSLAGGALCFAVGAGFHLTNGLIAVTVFFILLARRAPWRRFAEFYFSYSFFILVLFGGYALATHRPVLSVLYDIFFAPNAYSGYRSSAFHPVALSTVAASFAALKNALVTDAGPWAWLICGATLALFVQGARPAPARDIPGFRLAMLCWSLPFFVFFTLWDTANIEFKLNALLPLLLIAATGLTRLRPFLAGMAGGALAGGLLLVNLVFAIRPQADIRNNVRYRTAAAIGRATPANAQVVIAGTSLGYAYGKIYIPYFARREVVILDWALGKGGSLAAIRSRLEAASRAGRPVYALAEAVEEGKVMAALLAFHRVAAGEFSRFRSGMRLLPVAHLPGGQRLYRLEFPAPG